MSLRLRLQVVLSILLGDQIYLSEGWALDSVAFLEVANEVSAAVVRLQSRLRTRRPRGIEAFSPFRVELHEGRTYLDTFAEYLTRGDCKWSGYPDLRGNQDHQDHIAAQVKGLGTQWTREAVFRVFADGFRDEVMGEAIANMADYTSRFAADRAAAWSRPQGTFSQNLSPYLRNLRASLHQSELEGEIGSLDDLLGAIGRDPGAGHSSSRFLEIARQGIGPALMPAIDHLVRVTYMDISTRGVGGQFGAPIRGADTAHGVQIADAAATGAMDHAALEFRGSTREHDLLIGQLDSLEDWTGIWDSLLELALSDLWRQLVAQIRADAAELRFADSLFDRPSFAAAEAMLSQHSPQLALFQSGADRMGLSASSGSKLDRTVQIIFVTLPLRILGFAASLLLPGGPGTVAGGVAVKLGEQVAEKRLKPFSAKGHLATTIMRHRPILA